jgi:hypothetical protein
MTLALRVREPKAGRDARAWGNEIDELTAETMVMAPAVSTESVMTTTFNRGDPIA